MLISYDRTNIIIQSVFMVVYHMEVSFIVTIIFYNQEVWFFDWKQNIVK